MTPTLWGCPVAVVDSSDDSNVVGVSSGVGVMLGKAVGNLAKSIGIGVGISLTLAVVVSTIARVADVSSRVTSEVSTVANSTVAGDTSVTVVNTSDHTNVVGVASGVGVVLGKTVSDLTEGVSISISISLRLSLGVGLSLTLAVVVSTIASIADVSSRVTSEVSTVADASLARDTSMTVVNTSDHSNIMGVASGISIGLGKTVGNLAEGVGICLSIRVSLGGDDGQEDNGEGFHLSWIEAD